MHPNATRRRFLIGTGAAGSIALAGCLGEDADDDGEGDDDEGDDEGTDDGEEAVGYELWAADQGLDTIYIYESGGGEAEFELVDEIDTAADGGEVPHMVDYSSDYEYAAVACTAGARTLIYRTEDRELVANLETGAGSHFAGFSPDDEYLHVDVIGEETIVRIDADLEAESFEIADEIDLRTDETVLEAGIEEGAPICHQYDADGRSLHTLGPSYHDGALVIVDHESFAVDVAVPGEELPTNCGTVPHPTEEKFYLTAGLPSDPEEGEEGVGDYYVYDTANDEVLLQEDTGGIDAHGFWFTPDGEELWVLNRETNDGVVVDPDTDEVIDEIEAFGPEQSAEPAERDAPDIMWSSPDGQYMFVTLRGPVPVSGDPHAATGVTPGISVLDVESREIVDVIEPDPIEDYSEEHVADEEPSPDFHGVGVRPLGDADGFTSPPY